MNETTFRVPNGFPIETMTPARLRQIAQQLENNCREYQDKVFGNAVPCRTCAAMTEELREFSNRMQLREK